MRAKYEEKTFESYFNSELDRVSSVYFPVGQVQEGTLGFDSVSFSHNLNLWGLMGFPDTTLPPPGVDLQFIAREMEGRLNRLVNNIPSMKVNLLFQYKRSDFMILSTASEWPHWNQPYYRYDIYQEQQELLAHIEKVFNTEVIVLYAAPVAETVTELVKLKINNAIIQSTNFRKASELTGHHRNTFIEAGSHSIACSEPKTLAHLNIVELLNAESYRLSDNKTQNIIGFSRDIRQCIYDTRYLRHAFDLRMQSLEQFRDYQLFYSLESMKIIRELTGLQWIIAT